LLSHLVMFVITPCHVCYHTLSCLLSHLVMFVITPCNVCYHTLSCLLSHLVMFVITPGNVCYHTLSCLLSHLVMFVITPGNVCYHMLSYLISHIIQCLWWPSLRFVIIYIHYSYDILLTNWQCLHLPVKIELLISDRSLYVYILARSSILCYLATGS